MQKTNDQWVTPLAPGTLYFTSDDRIVYDTADNDRVIISNYPDKAVLADTATIALYDGSNAKDNENDLIPISERFINFQSGIVSTANNNELATYTYYNSIGASPATPKQYGIQENTTATKWTGGTSAGPQLTIGMKGMPNIALPAIPAAAENASGIVTTTTQAFAGAKTFKAATTFEKTVTISQGQTPSDKSNGDLYVTGGIKINGASQFGSTLSTGGKATLNSLEVTTNAAITGTLGVTGATTLSNTLTVSGNSTLNGNVTIGNAAADVVTVNGTPTFKTAITAESNLSISGNIIPSATSTLGTSTKYWQALYVGNGSHGENADGTKATPAITANGDVSVAYNLSATTSNIGTLTVTTGNLTTVNAGTLKATGATTLSSTLTVNGASNFKGNVTIGDASTDTVTINGTPTFKTAITANSNITVGGNIVPSATSTLGTSAKYWQALYVGNGAHGENATPAITANGDVSVTYNLSAATSSIDTLTATTSNLTTVNVSGVATCASGSTLTTAGTVNLGGTVNFTGSNLFSKHIYLTGAVANSSTASTSQIVFGTAADNHVAISSNTNAIVINQNLTQTASQIVLSVNPGTPTTFKTGLGVSGGATFSNAVTVSGAFAANSTSTFAGAVSMNSTLTVNNAITGLTTVTIGSANNSNPYIKFVDSAGKTWYAQAYVQTVNDVKVSKLYFGATSVKALCLDENGNCEIPLTLTIGTTTANGKSIIQTNANKKAIWTYTVDDTNKYSIIHPSKNGTIALTSDIPTLSGLGGVSTVSASGTAPLSLSASKTGTSVSITGSVAAASSTSAGVVSTTTQTFAGNKTFTGNIVSNGTITGTKVYGSVWNDYAEYRQTHHKVKPGQCVYEKGDGSLAISYERMMPGANIVSDTFGFAIGETKNCKTPLAVSGRVLAYAYEPKETYNPGDAVCSGPNGTISKMTRAEIRDYPERIIGTVSEIPTYEVWGSGNVKVNGRIWIKVK